MRAVDEVRVGVVVVLALLLALSGYFFLRGAGPLSRMDEYRLLVEQGVAIVATGNDVRFEGVKVGEIKKVELDAASQKPLLTLSIERRQPPIKLHSNYLYTVRAVSPIGENYVDIRPNPEAKGAAGAVYAANSSQPIRGGRAIPGLTEAGEQVAGAAANATKIAQRAEANVSRQVTTLSRDLRTTMGKFNVTLDRINKGVLSYPNQIKLAQTLDGVARLTQSAQQGFGPQGIRVALGDARSQRALNSALENAALTAREGRSVARNLSRLTGDLGGVVGENRGQLRALLGSLNRASTGVAGLTQNLNATMRDGKFQENAQIAFGSLRRAAENVEAGTAGFKAIAGDPTTQQNLRDTLDALRETTETLRDTAAIVNEAVADPETQGQVKGILTSLNATAGTLQTAVENLNAISAGLKNVVADPQVQLNLKETAANLNGTLAATRAAAEQRAAGRQEAQPERRRKRRWPERRDHHAPEHAVAERRGFHRSALGRSGTQRGRGGPQLWRPFFQRRIVRCAVSSGPGQHRRRRRPDAANGPLSGPERRAALRNLPLQAGRGPRVSPGPLFAGKQHLGPESPLGQRLCRLSGHAASRNFSRARAQRRGALQLHRC